MQMAGDKFDTPSPAPANYSGCFAKWPSPILEKSMIVATNPPLPKRRHPLEHQIILHFTSFYSTVLHFTLFYYILLHFNFTLFYFILLYFTSLSSILLYFARFYSILLNFIHFYFYFKLFYSILLNVT